MDATGLVEDAGEVSGMVGRAVGKGAMARGIVSDPALEVGAVGRSVHAPDGSHFGGMNGAAMPSAESDHWRFGNA